MTTPPEMTPEEALAFASDTVNVSAGLGMAALSAMSNPASFAGILLILQDIITGDCPCDSCTRIRENFETLSGQWSEMFPEGPVGLPG